MRKQKKRKQKKMWFLCYDCFNYDWLPAEKHLVDYYEDLGNDFCYCPYCDRECPMVMEVGRKPVKPITVAQLFSELRHK